MVRKAAAGPPEDGAGGDLGPAMDEGMRLAAAFLAPIVHHIVDDLAVENINGAEVIEFGERPEVGCLRRRKLAVKRAIGGYVDLFEVSDEVVAKIVLLSPFSGYDAFQREVEFTRRAAELGVGGRVLDAFPCTSRRKDHYGVLLLENVFGRTLQDWIDSGVSDPQKRKMRKDVERLVERMHEGGLYHNRMWSGSVVVTRDGRPLITEFGQAGATPKVSRATTKSGKRHSDFSVLTAFDDRSDGFAMTRIGRFSDALVVKVARAAMRAGVVCISGAQPAKKVWCATGEKVRCAKSKIN